MEASVSRRGDPQHLDSAATARVGRFHVLWGVPGRIARFMLGADNDSDIDNGNNAAASTAGSRAGAALPSLAACQPFFEREMARARRYERPLGIVVHDFDPVWAFAPDLARVLVGSLRITDLAALDAARKQVVVLLPETDRAQAESVAARLRRLVESPGAVHLRAGTAVFPADALILDDLVAVAARARGPAPDARAPEPRGDRAPEGVA